MRQHLLTFLLLPIILCACEREGKNVWSDIDYAKIARDNYRRENDTNYTPPPSVLGCTDDDLYNCRR